jgi:hypothetical protein
MYPVVFFDALRVKIREEAVVRNKAIYLALGVLPDGSRGILGLWIENTESSRANSSQVGINTRSLAISSAENAGRTEPFSPRRDSLGKGTRSLTQPRSMAVLQTRLNALAKFISVLLFGSLPILWLRQRSNSAMC